MWFVTVKNGGIPARFPVDRLAKVRRTEAVQLSFLT
jgi:hypothetical protein